MEDKDQNGNTGYNGVNFGLTQPPPLPGVVDLNDPLSGVDVPSPTPTQPLQPQKLGVGRFARLLKRADVWLVLASLIAVVAFIVGNAAKNAKIAKQQVTKASQYATVQIPLGSFVPPQEQQAANLGMSNVVINGGLEVNDSLVLAPMVQPAKAVAGQLYYNQATNQLTYYNGTRYASLADSNQVVQSIGGTSGQFALGGGLGVVGNQLSNTGVVSVGGATGAITLGNGLGLVGNTLQNRGVLSLTAGTSNLAITNDGNGNLTINNVGAGTGTVTSGGGTSGSLPVYTGAQNIENSVISQSGVSVTIAGDLSVTGGIVLLGNPLSVSNGGTGTASLAANGVVVGNGTAALGSITSSSAGLCLLSTAGAPVFAACPSSSGVATLNGLNGAVTVANTSAAGSTITINDATTSSKGIASYNSANFSVGSGVVNTIQDINTAATPSFATLTLSSSQAVNPMLVVNNTAVGPTGNLLDLQIGGLSKFSVQPSGNVTGVGTYNGQTISSTTSFTGTVDIAGKTTLAGGDLAINGGNITSTSPLSVSAGGALTVGSTGQKLALQGDATSTFVVANGGNTTAFAFQAPTANVTYTLPTATAGSYDICTTAGNCGSGGTISSSGGNANQLAKFTGAQTIADSSISDNGSTVTTSANLVVQGGNAIIGIANSVTGSLTLGFGLANASATIEPGTLTTSRTYTLPDSDGTICLSSGNCLGGGGGGANTSLSNLTSVAINTSLLPGSSTIDLGSATAPFRNLYLAGSSASPTINNFEFTGTPTAPRTITFPDQSGTICLNNSVNCGFLTGVGTAFVQDGNTLGKDANLGTGDGYALNLLTNGLARLTLSNAGNATFSGNVTINGSTLTTPASGFNITPAGALSMGSGSQVLTLQGNSSSTLAISNAGNTTTFAFQAPTANVTYTLPTATAGSYDICTTAGNCTGVGGTVTASGGTTGYLPLFNGAQTLGNSHVSDNGTTVTTSINLSVQGGAISVGVPNSVMGAIALADGTANASGTIQPGTLTTSRTYTLPDADGTICLSSGNCLGGGSGGADTSLSNLTSVAINTSLLPGSATIDLGSATAPFRNLYFAGSSVTPGTNNFTITGTATAPRTITVPDASGTLCLEGDTNCGFATGSGNAFVQGGNALGTVANLGTNDTNDLNLRTNGITRLTVSATGSTTLSGSLAVDGGSITSGGALQISPTGTLTLGVAGQTSTLQGNMSTSIVANSGGLTTTVGFSGTPTGSVIYNFDNSAAAGTYMICSSIGNCASAGGGVTTGGGTANYVPVFTGAQTIGKSSITDDGTTIGLGEDVTIAANKNLTLSSGTGSVTQTFANMTGAASTLVVSDSSAGGASSVQGFVVDLSGTNTAGTNTISGISFGNVTSATNNAFYGINFGTGLTDLLRYNGQQLISGTGFVQNAAFDTAVTYSNLTQVGTLTAGSIAAGFGTITTNNTITGTSLNGTIGVNTGSGVGAQRIDASGNLVNIGTISSGSINGQTISSAANFTGTLGVGGLATLSGGANVTGTLGANMITPTAALTVGAIGQAFTLQGNTASKIVASDGTNATTVDFTGTATGSVSYNFDRAAAAGSYDICTTAGNCVGLGGGVSASGATTNYIPVFSGSQSLINSILSQPNATTISAAGNINIGAGYQYQINGVQIASANLSDGANLALLNASETFTGGTVSFKNGVDSSNAFNVLNAAGNSVLTVSTASSGEVILGKTNSLAGSLVFNTATSAYTTTITATPPATANQTITLPDASGVVCLDSGNCSGTGATLQSAYTNSTGGTTPKIKLNSTLLGVDIQDADTTIGADLFDVRASNSSGLGLVMFGVGNTGQVTLQNSSNSATAFRLLTQGGTAVLTGDTQGGQLVLGQASALAGKLVFANATNANTGTIQTVALGQNTVYTLPDPGVAGAANICLSTGNCAGAGSGVTASGGTATYIPVFTGSQQLGNSRITDTGTAISLGLNSTVNNSANTNSTLTVQASNSPATGQALLYVNNSAASPTGSLLSLNTGGTNRLNLNSTGALTLYGGQTDDITTRSTPVSGGAGVNFTLQAGLTNDYNVAGGNLYLYGGDAGDVTSSGGSAYIDGGLSSGGGNGGAVYVGTGLARTTNIDIGHASASGYPVTTTTVNGFLSVNNIGSYALNVNTSSSLTDGITFSGTIGADLYRGSGTLTLQGNGGLSATTQNLSGAATGAITIQSGNVTSGAFSSGNVNIDVGTSTGSLGSINIGTNTNNTHINIGSWSGSGSTNGSVIRVGDNGTSTGTQYVYIGSAGNANNVTTILGGATGGLNLGTSGAQTINIGNNSSTTSVSINAGTGGYVDIGNTFAVQNVHIGSSGSTATTTIQGGNGVTISTPNTAGANIMLQTDSSTSSIIAQSSINSAAAFVVEDSSAVARFTVDTINGRIYLGPTGGDYTGSALLVLNNKLNSGDPTGVEGAMYYNAQTKTYRCYRDNEWENCGVNPIDRGFLVEDEFMGGCNTSLSTNHIFGQLGWTKQTIGADGSFNCNPSNPAPSADHPGVLYIITPAVASEGDTLTLGNSNGGSVVIGSSYTVKQTLAAGSTTGFVMRSGLHNETTATTQPVSGVWWEADPATSPDWRYCYGDGTTATCTATSVAIAANTWVRLEIQVTAVGAGTSAATFTINGTPASVSGVTIDSTNRVYPANVCYATGAVAEQCSYDYFQLSGIASAAR